jgi:hypothetical protein
VGRIAREHHRDGRDDARVHAPEHRSEEERLEISETNEGD